jgi:predicted RNase H-like HicB family nuclease
LTIKLIFKHIALSIFRYLWKKGVKMERVVNLHIEKLPEGFYLATSDSIQGLIAQGRTIAETIEIAKDVAKKLIEAQEDQISP